MVPSGRLFPGKGGGPGWKGRLVDPSVAEGGRGMPATRQLGATWAS